MDVVPLPSPSDFIDPGTMCQAAGWGQTGVTDPASYTYTLREVELRIMDVEACKIFSDYDYNFQMCVGSPGRKRSPYEVSTHLLFLPTSGDSVSEGNVPNSSP